MKVLVVFAHPRRDSYTGALMDALVSGLEEEGHGAEIADIYREDFEVRFQPEDYAQFAGGEMPEDVRREQFRVQQANALAFVFPVWWWSFPAALKGWVDRVFSAEWAYSFEPQVSRGRLQDRPTLLLGVAGSRESTYRKYRYDEAMRVQIDVGVLGYCGLRDVVTEIFYDVEQSPDIRSRYLIEAKELGRTFLSAARKPRVPQLSSTRPS